MRVRPFRHLRLKVISVVTATLLWMAVAGEQTVERVLRVPLELQQFPQEDAGNIIASLIIERQEQKIKLRNQNKPGTGTDIPEMEKW